MPSGHVLHTAEPGMDFACKTYWNPADALSWSEGGISFSINANKAHFPGVGPWIQKYCGKCVGFVLRFHHKPMVK